MTDPNPTSLAEGLRRFHRQWLEDKREYYLRKLARREAVESSFSTRGMIRAYLTLVAELAGIFPSLR